MNELVPIKERTILYVAGRSIEFIVPTCTRYPVCRVRFTNDRATDSLTTLFRRYTRSSSTIPTSRPFPPRR